MESFIAALWTPVEYQAEHMKLSRKTDSTVNVKGPRKKSRIHDIQEVTSQERGAQWDFNEHVNKAWVKWRELSERKSSATSEFANFSRRAAMVRPWIWP